MADIGTLTFDELTYQFDRPQMKESTDLIEGTLQLAYILISIKVFSKSSVNRTIHYLIHFGQLQFSGRHKVDDRKV